MDYIAAEFETDDAEDAATVDEPLDCDIDAGDVATICLILGVAFGIGVWLLACIGAAYMAGWLQ